MTAPPTGDEFDKSPEIVSSDDLSDPSLAALEALEAVDDLADRAEASPLKWVRWTPPQLALLRSVNPRTLLRSGNQFGKTWAGLAECIYRCLGRHPYKAVKPAPIEAWIITTSWLQSLAVQKKLWHLLPKDELVEGCCYRPKQGFGKPPIVEFKNGSVIQIRTSGQGGLNLSSATLDFILCDEPLPSSRIYSEADRRLTRTGGALFSTMTPVNAPVEWVQELVEEGKIHDLHFTMKPKNFIPEGWDRPLRTEEGVPMDAAWIQAQRDSVLSWEAPVILDGEWEFRATERIFERYVGRLHQVPNLLRSPLRPTGEVWYALGLDYGEERLRTAAVLIAVVVTGAHPKLWILDEYVPETATDEAMDAEGILAMLARNGMEWADLDYAYGDKRYTDASGLQTRKSNKTMMGELEKVVGVRSLRPRLKSAKRGPGRGKGAVYSGVKWLNSRMIRPGHFYMDARCVWGDECFNKWDGAEKSKYKDWIDALRYAATKWIFRRRGRPHIPALR